MKTPHFSQLTDTIKKLRDPETGCPWDLRQDHKSLLKFLLEESYEFIHAVENNPDEMEEELGDILLQVLLHSQIASESNRFDIESVSQKLNDKMIRRHPHVFSENYQVDDRSSLTDEKLQKTWDAIKQQEKSTLKKSDETILLKPDSFLGPALQASSKIGAKTKKYNFDWDNVSQVMYKVEEEWQELKAEIPPQSQDSKIVATESIKEELGDLLFSVAQLARHLEIDPEECLRAANNKFLKRFNQMNKFITQDQNQITKLDHEHLESYWQKAKNHNE